jgi:hypothetical protein
MLNTTTTTLPDDAPDQFVPDPVVWKEFGVCSMTGDRWDKDPRMAELGWPPPIRIKSRKFRSRRMLEKFKNALLSAAIAARTACMPPPKSEKPATAGGEPASESKRLGDALKFEANPEPIENAPAQALRRREAAS